MIILGKNIKNEFNNVEDKLNFAIITIKKGIIGLKKDKTMLTDLYNSIINKEKEVYEKTGLSLYIDTEMSRLIISYLNTKYSFHKVFVYFTLTDVTDNKNIINKVREILTNAIKDYYSVDYAIEILSEAVLKLENLKKEYKQC